VESRIIILTYIIQKNMALEITSDSFEQEVTQSSVPVLVDFWAEWCGPCRIMSPIVEEIGNEVDGTKLKVAKVNVDQAQDLAMQHGVMSIPSFKVFKDGGVVKEFVGARSKEEVMEFLSEFLN
jgi:thioredoxin 1